VKPHHIGHVVDDIPRAVEWAAATLGAGPFLLIEHLAFDEVTFKDEPAAYDHSSAFGQWGAVKLELTQIHGGTPALVEEMRRGHVAWLSDDLDAERLPGRFHTGRSGPVRAHWYRSPLGPHVEILQRSPEIEAFYEAIRSAADGWDGSRPLRSP
jgi:hypothetical protein